jgi:hypothetical protein
LAGKVWIGKAWLGAARQAILTGGEKMVYKWKNGARFKADASKIGEELSSLGEKIAPAAVVKKARNKKAELHKCFEWDDSKAAEEYRLNQAREVMRSITIVVENKNRPDNRQMTIRVYEHVNLASDNPDDDRQSVYVPTMKALSDPDMREQVKGRLKSDIENAEQTAEAYEYLVSSFGEVRKRLQAARQAITD